MTINVTDESEPPLAPAKPDVKDGGPDVLEVTWTAPANVGRPAITGYNLRYKRSGNFILWPNTAAATDRYAEIKSLRAGDYEVQVRALNADGKGTWSQSGEATIGGNQSPVVDETKLSDITVAVGGADQLVPVGAAFSDPDADSLTLSASSRDDDIATATVSGSSVSIHAVALGTVDVDVTATDPDGASATGSFKVTVVSAPPTPPAPGLSLNLGQDILTVTITDTFGPLEARAYDIRIWRKSDPADLHTYCATLTIKLDTTVVATIGVPIPIGSFAIPNTTYQVTTAISAKPVRTTRAPPGPGLPRSRPPVLQPGAASTSTSCSSVPNPPPRTRRPSMRPPPSGNRPSRTT